MRVDDYTMFSGIGDASPPKYPTPREGEVAA